MRRSQLALESNPATPPPTKRRPTEQSHRPAVLRSRMVTRLPLFYGWIIVPAAIMGRVMTSPGQTLWRIGVR